MIWRAPRILFPHHQGAQKSPGARCRSRGFQIAEMASGTSADAIDLDQYRVPDQIPPNLFKISASSYQPTSGYPLLVKATAPM